MATSLDLSYFVIQKYGNDLSDSEGGNTKNYNILFLPSFDEHQRTYLLEKSECLLYTPSNEHFGIVPVEAMYAHLPVVAVESGGPTETIVHGVTGYLCDPVPETFSDFIKEILTSSKEKRTAMGQAGSMRAKSKFSLESFSKELDDIVVKSLAVQQKDVHHYTFWISLFVLMFLILFIYMF